MIRHDDGGALLIPEWQEKGHAALGVRESHTQTHDGLAPRYSNADIARRVDSDMAAAGGFDLAGFPRLCAWLTAKPGYVKLEDC